ncbi:cell division protein FtsL [Vibrio sp. HDW18]|uniref:cell division protein FtsL n=1 Tax=Vibrio sp. HDW18 TaxID=2714948 RepID=UPI00140A3D24|nr:cell division protein FtsL [Vibrio sp. HDW18]QIL85905.1 cell division protein FtsL [Vibrio sp. HDW18]
MPRQLPPNLAKLIALDLLTVGRLPLLLLLLIFSCAMAVVFMTHQARQAISAKDQAFMERERLDNEWRNLILEETALSEHSRVQQLARQDLQMQRPDSETEVVINLK